MNFYIHILGTDIPLYGLCFFAGILLCAVLAILLCPKRQIQRYDLVYAAIFAMIGAVIGAKLLFIVVSWEEIVRLKISLLGIIKGGFVFYGGLLGGALGMWIYTRMYHLKTLDFFDVCAVVVPLGHAIGRVGCFFAGCCYGIPYDGIFSYTYTSTAGLTPLGVPLLPIQLIEAACLLLLFFVMLGVFLKNPMARGRITCLYFLSYPVIRFVLEFFRGDRERGLFLGISTSQWVSLGLFILVVIYMAFSAYQKKNKKLTSDP